VSTFSLNKQPVSSVLCPLVAILWQSKQRNIAFAIGLELWTWHHHRTRLCFLSKCEFFFFFCRFEKIDLNPVHAGSRSATHGCLQFKIFQNLSNLKSFYPADQKYLFKHSKINIIYNLIHFLIINFIYRLVTMVNCEIEKTWWNFQEVLNLRSENIIIYFLLF
jgi:hypothetical protein